MRSKPMFIQPALLSRSGWSRPGLVAGHRGPNARVVHLNLAPGILDAGTVLEVLSEAIPVPAGTVMEPPAGFTPPFHDLQPRVGNSSFPQSSKP
jgi:hypothetical protein